MAFEVAGSVVAPAIILRNQLANNLGTCRFGSDPKTSVLDLNCKAHDLDNLYVVDGGFMVTSAAVNPTLTIIANALRVGDHLLERLEAKEAGSKAEVNRSVRSHAELVMAK